MEKLMHKNPHQAQEKLQKVPRGGNSPQIHAPFFLKKAASRPMQFK
jgi:hypothetical protein